jgi:hypothetical protein
MKEIRVIIPMRCYAMNVYPVILLLSRGAGKLTGYNMNFNSVDLSERPGEFFDMPRNSADNSRRILPR